MNETPSFFQRLATAARAVFTPGFAGGKETAEAAVLPQGTTPPQRGLAQLIGGYATMPWLRAVAERIGRSVASCDWQLYFPQTTRGRAELRSLRRDAPQRERRAWFRRLADSGDIREIESHPFLDAWERPNPALNGFNTRMLTTLYLDLGGDGEWLLERNLAGMPIGWWPIPPTWVLSFPTAVEQGYRVNLPGWTGTIPAGEVVSFVNVNPADPYGRGSAIARALADELETDEFTAKHLKGFFYNRARPDLLIYGKSMAELDKPQKRQLELDWRAKVGGLWNFWKPYFMRLAEVQVKELSQTLESMQMTDLRAHQRDTVLHVFGAPPEVFGILENSNRSTIQAADFLFQKHLVVPRLELLRQTVQEALLPQYDERLVFEYVSPVEEDEEFYLKVAQAAPAVRSVDEWRELQGLGPHPDPRSGSAHLVSFSTESRADLRPAEKVPPTQAPPPPPVAVQPEDEDPEDPEPDEGEMPVEEPDDDVEAVAAKGVVATVTYAAGEPPRLHVDTIIRGYSAQDLIQLIHDVSDKVSPEVVAILLAALSAGRAAVDPKKLAGLLTSGQIAQVLAALPYSSIDEGIRQASAALRKALTRAGELTALVLSEQTGTEIAFDAEHRDVAAWLLAAVGGFAAAMVVTSQSAVAETLEDFASGVLAAPAELVAELVREQVALDTNRARSLRTFVDELVEQGIPGDEMSASLARTGQVLREARAASAGADQAFAAATRGRYEMWRQAIASGAVPVTAERTWATSLVDVCPICAPMDGQTVGVTEQYFSPYNEEHYLSPGPPPDGPHVHCLLPTERVLPIGVLGVTTRHYEGEAVRLQTAGGHDLSVTPNHPVLTPSGWKPAGDLRPGDQVVRDCGANWMLGGAVDQIDGPPSIQQVADALLERGELLPVEVPVAAEDFHGDGVGSEVAVVARRLSLGNEGILSSLAKQAQQLALVPAVGLPAPRTGLEAGGHLGGADVSSPTGGVRGADLAAALGGGHLLPAEQEGVAHVAGGQPLADELLLDRGPADSELFRERLDGRPAEVAFSERRELGAAPSVPADAPELDPCAQEEKRRLAVAQAEASSDAGERFAIEVALDRIVTVHRFVHSGHVLNLETRAGCYVAEGLIVHNCHCGEFLVF